jgi:hypothetical protein
MQFKVIIFTYLKYNTVYMIMYLIVTPSNYDGIILLTALNYTSKYQINRNQSVDITVFTIF